MNWLSLPFVPEPKDVSGITVVPDHVYISGPLGFANGILSMAFQLNKLVESAYTRLTPIYQLVELEIPPGFWVSIPIPPHRIFHHRWLGWMDKSTGEIPFEIHIREFRMEDFSSSAPPPFSTLQHYGWAVQSVEDFGRIEENEQKAGKRIVPQSIDRGDGVNRIYVVEQFDDIGKIEINEYLWKPAGFRQKVLEG